MRENRAFALLRLLDAMPALRTGEELILLPDRDRPTVTLRRNDAPPVVFAMRRDMPVPLDPAADTRLPGAALLSDKGLANETLSPLTGPISSCQLVAWRPGRRAVMRIQLQDGGTRWLKLLDPKSFRRATAAFHEVGAARAPLRLVLPRHFLPAICGYVSEPARGVSLRALLAGPTVPSLELVSRAISGLAATTSGMALPAHDFFSARAATIGMLKKAAPLRPALEALAGMIADLEPPPPPARYGFVHGDLHDKQLFLTKTSAHLIDLEGMAFGDTRFDAVNLAEHLRLRDLQHGRAERGLGHALLARAGLDPDAPATSAFRLLIRARLCGVYALRPRWLGLCDRLHRESLALLSRLKSPDGSDRPDLRLPATTAG